MGTGAAACVHGPTKPGPGGRLARKEQGASERRVRGNVSNGTHRQPPTLFPLGLLARRGSQAWGCASHEADRGRSSIQGVNGYERQLEEAALDFIDAHGTHRALPGASAHLGAAPSERGVTLRQLQRRCLKASAFVRRYVGAVRDQEPLRVVVEERRALLL